MLQYKHKLCNNQQGRVKVQNNINNTPKQHNAVQSCNVSDTSTKHNHDEYMTHREQIMNTFTSNSYKVI